MADEFAKLALQTDEFKEANRSVEFNEPNCRRYMPASRRAGGVQAASPEELGTIS